MSVVYTTWPLAMPAPIEQSARDVATLLFSDYVLAFEVISLLLLAAVIGGIYLARRDTIPDPADPVTRSDAVNAASPGGRRHEPLARRLPRALLPHVRHRHVRVPRTRNAIAMLMCVEVMLNAVNLAIVAFGMFTPALAGARARSSRCS